jgi:2-oxoglutarate ferredoxin oxidoreductase subunit beta
MTTSNLFDNGPQDIAWCPGCGNYAILNIVKNAYTDLGLTPRNMVVVSGIGQAPKTPHYFAVNMFNGLHGRALPAAAAIKAGNPSLTVIAEGGDGDMYGEGGNHFIHNIRRNPDITHLVHNNMVYGLTKGQASPTSALGMKTPLQIDGVISEPINPIAVAIALDASFVARAFCGDEERTKEIIKQAIRHKGYSLVDILQNCVTYNKINTYKWYKDHTRYLDETYNPRNRAAAFATAIEEDPLPLGVIYRNDRRPVFEEQLPAYREDKRPLFAREEIDKTKLETVMMRSGSW